jgi:peptidoglycan-associated lipoprotein
MGAILIYRRIGCGKFALDNLAKGGISLKTYQKSQKNIGFVLTVLLLIVFTVSCSPKQSTQSEMAPPPPIETEPTVVEFDSSRVSDILKDGDIPEEDRGELSWLPKRPPLGMRFENTDSLQTVYFEFDKYSLTKKARTILEANAEWLRANPQLVARIEGHCDERGTLEYNQVLGENRAISVKKYLVTLGVAPDRLYTISYGETMPAESGHNEEAWAKNRRAYFKIGQ